MNSATTAPNTMGAGNRGHVLPVPKYFAGLRLLQLLLAIIILGMSAYGVHYITYDGFCLSLFTALMTMLLTLYILVAELVMPKLYIYWAILAIDIFGVIFWLASMITMAVNTSHFHKYSYSYYNYYTWFKRDVIAKRDTTRKTYRNVMITTSVFDAFELILFLATLALTVIYLMRHRRNNGPAMYNSGATTHTTTAAAPGAAGVGAPVHEHGHVTKDMELAGQPMHHNHQPVVEPKDDSLPVQHPPPVTHTGHTAV